MHVQTPILFEGQQVLTLLYAILNAIILLNLDRGSSTLQA
jgi:hypothetical protein